ncbi:hypothetical protein TcWFU_000887 [Taenia crassiceps]|uniref:Uncharacterized protein n=1 Tax=Taenia crassiceps TaxID=6207 RepID=A0ABR4QCJ6_9CEST
MAGCLGNRLLFYPLRWRCWDCYFHPAFEVAAFSLHGQWLTCASCYHFRGFAWHPRPKLCFLSFLLPSQQM